MEKIKIQGFKLKGLKLGKKTTNENGMSAIDCGELWQRFQNENWYQRIPNKISDAIYAVYYEYEGDHTQPYSYFIGCKVHIDSEPADNMNSLLILEDEYIKFEARGKMPDCIANCWKDIWSSSIDRSYRYDFEIYGERSRDWNSAEVEVYVSGK